MGNKNYLTVEEFNSYINNLFCTEELLQNVPIVGEVSGCSIINGHCYFTLKDENAQVKVISFNCDRTYIPKNGEQIKVIGGVDFYVKNGNLSIKAYFIEPFGIGDLFRKLEILKEKLRNEGLFSEAHKKIVPRYPNKIAIVTSSQGAAIQDIISTIYKNNKQQEITIIDVRVQGFQSAEDITKAVKNADRASLFDVIIITRGGGSFEDLYSFNDEKLVRTIYNANTPIISAVGHETDYCLCDYVADERVITPTAAAERVGYNIEELKKYISELKNMMKKNLENKIEKNNTIIRNLLNKLKFEINNTLKDQNNYIKNMSYQIKNNISKIIISQENKINEYQNLLNAYNPKNMFQKGYFRILKNGKCISEIKNMEINDKIEIYGNDGKAEANIISKEINNGL